MSSICLNMIVRNEAHVIERCLASVKPVIDYWVIVDTGSTDDTCALIERSLAGIPGELHRRPWHDFARNRTEALQLARDKADYLLFIDADMTVNVKEGFDKELTADAYWICSEGATVHYNLRIAINSIEWRYMGVTHEYLDRRNAKQIAKLETLTVTHHADGGMRADKYRRDKELLENALRDDPDNTRHQYYLAQTCSLLNDYESALDWYTRRAHQDDGSEECWHAHYQLAKLREMTQRPWSSVLHAYLDAYQYRPTRAEPLFRIANLYENNGQHALAYLFSRRAMDIAYPDDDILFIERSVYDYQLPVQHALVCYYLGKHDEAILAANRALDCPDLPEGFLERIVRNRQFSLREIYPRVPDPPNTVNRMVVVTSFYNAGPLLQDCIKSILAQDHPNFVVIATDDASIDDSIRYLPADDPRFTILRNPKRVGSLANMHHAVMSYCRGDDIVVQVDGDDALISSDALSYVNAYYNQADCWVMYGQFQTDDGGYGLARPFASEADLRGQFDGKTPKFPVHVMTFRAGLYHAIRAQDPDFNCMKNEQGEWLFHAQDVAVMRALFLSAGFGRVRFNDRVLYFYRSKENPLSQSAAHRAGLVTDCNTLALKSRLKRIDRY